MAGLPIMGHYPSTNTNKSNTQVYQATHKGENYLPFMYRSFISFSYGGKNIEDFNLISVFTDRGMNKAGYANFEDITSTHEVLDGQTFWGTHYTNNELTMTLSTDGLSQMDLDKFLLWFSPGVAKELILAEHPNRAIMARVKEPPRLELMPFEYSITTYLGNYQYTTKTTKYKGDISISFVMDDPFWYSKINIFGNKDPYTGVYHDTWIDANNLEMSVYNDPDALKIAVEDGIPISSMLQASLLLGDNIFANIDSDMNAKVAYPNADIKLEIISGEDKIILTSYVHLISYDENDRVVDTIEEEGSFPLESTSTGVFSGNIEFYYYRIYNLMQEYPKLNNNEIITITKEETIGEIYTKLLNWFGQYRSSNSQTEVIVSNADSERVESIIIKLNSLLADTLSQADKDILSNDLNQYDLGDYTYRLFPSSDDSALVNKEVAKILLDNMLARRGIKDWTTQSVCAKQYENSELVEVEGALVAGAVMSDDTGIDTLRASDKGYFYYAGTAPSKPKLRFTIIPPVVEYYIVEPANIYSGGSKLYSTITIESVHKQEFKFTTPSLWTGYNQAIAIFSNLNNMIGDSWENVREQIRANVRHRIPRAWANRVIDSLTNGELIISSGKQRPALERMRKMLKSNDGSNLSSTFEFDSATGTAIGYLQCCVPQANQLPTDDNEWVTYGDPQMIIEDVGDMVRSPYLIIHDRNYPDKFGNIQAFVEDNSQEGIGRTYSHIIYHDLNRTNLKNIYIEYQNMYL